MTTSNASELLKAAEPKSDQLNADALIGGPKVIKITKVELKLNAPQQKVWVYFEGDNGKPWKPCVSMIRALAHVWPDHYDNYVGRSVELVNDPSVVFGGEKLGGIRITKMSDMPSESMTFMLTVTRGKKKPYTVRRLEVKESNVDVLRDAAKRGTEAFRAAWSSSDKATRDLAQPIIDELKAIATAADASKGGAV